MVRSNTGKATVVSGFANKFLSGPAVPGTCFFKRIPEEGIITWRALKGSLQNNMAFAPRPMYSRVS